MKRAPYMTNTTLSRRQRHLRTHHYALIQLATRQKLIMPTKHSEKRANACQANPAFGLTGSDQQVYQIGPEASPTPQSP